MQRHYRNLVNDNVQAAKQPQQDNLVVGVIFLYTLYILAPVLLYTYSFGWYMHLGLCVMIFLIYRQAIDISASKIYIVFSLLHLLGAFLSIFRVADISGHMYLMLGNALGFFSFLILIPSFSSPKVRIAFLSAVVVAAFAWTIQIQTQMGDYRYLLTPYYLKGVGNDKNFIAFILSLACTASFAAIFFLNLQSKHFPRRLVVMGLLAVSAYFAYHVFLTYSRSGLVTAFVGLLGVFAMVLRKRGLSPGIILFGAVLSFTVYYFVLDFLPQIAPQWVGYFDEDRLGMRVSDIQKALAIIADNPVLGIGIDQSKDSYSVLGQLDSYGRGLPHNLYLKTWAEVGLLGIIGFVVWFLFFWKKLGTNFDLLPDLDRIAMLIFIPLFTMLLFLDLSTIANYMLALMVGMFYSKAGG